MVSALGGVASCLLILHNQAPGRLKEDFCFDFPPVCLFIIMFEFLTLSPQPCGRCCPTVDQAGCLTLVGKQPFTWRNLTENLFFRPVPGFLHHPRPLSPSLCRSGSRTPHAPAFIQESPFTCLGLGLDGENGRSGIGFLRHSCRGQHTGQGRRALGWWRAASRGSQLRPCPHLSSHPAPLPAV